MKDPYGLSIIADEQIRRMVGNYVRLTVKGLGGEKNLAAGQRTMIVLQRILLGLILRLERDLMVPDLNAEPSHSLRAFRTLASLANTFRHGQVALGLALRNPQTKRGPKTYEELMRAIAEASEEPEGGEGEVEKHERN